MDGDDAVFIYRLLHARPPSVLSAHTACRMHGRSQASCQPGRCIEGLMTPFYRWEHRQVQGEQATQARQRQGWDPTPNLLAQALSPGSLLGLLEKRPAAPSPITSPSPAPSG